MIASVVAWFKKYPVAKQHLGTVGFGAATFVFTHFFDYPLDVQVIATGVVVAFTGFLLRSWGRSETRETSLVNADGKPLLAAQMGRSGYRLSHILIVAGLFAAFVGSRLEVEIATIDGMSGSRTELHEPTKGLIDHPGIFQFEAQKIEPYNGIVFRLHRTRGFDKIIAEEIGIEYRRRCRGPSTTRPVRSA